MGHLVDYTFCVVHGGEHRLPGGITERGVGPNTTNSRTPMEVVNNLIEGF